MKKIILFSLVFIGLTTISNAQRLGARYDWLKMSYTKIPLQNGLPYYDTAINIKNGFTQEKLVENAHYYFNSIIGSAKVDTFDERYSAQGKYVIYTSDKKDEEHTFNVDYKIDLVYKNGKYVIEMHDFNIFYLTNKVEFEAKLKRAKMNDGHSNYFMALFNDMNKVEMRKFADVLGKNAIPMQATASN